MQTKIQRWGNSIGVRIPRSLAAEAGVEAGSEVELSVRDGDIVVKPASRARYGLDELLGKVTARNLHAEIDSGRRRGREVW
ncbi:MAG: AbrB/MazE/SpoVT family DNA-binding domain-containing protein [Phycisphaerales bacterium]